MSSPLLRRRLDGGLLARLLDDPELAPTLRALPAPALRQVILRVGLEDAGELVALASLDQLRDVFDEDLWRSGRPGRDESFDPVRFALWLEVLLECGEAELADRLAGLSEDFLVFALSQLVRVLDLATLTTWSADPLEAEQLDRILDAHFCQELDEHLLVSRSERGWDAVRTTLLALDERHPQRLLEVLCRCAAATHEEVDSAHDLSEQLEGEERLLEDARAEREARRAEHGYVAPSDARAFLALARTPPPGPERDPVTRAYFRELAPRDLSGARPDPSGGNEAPRPTPLRQLLLEAGVEPEPGAVEPGAAEPGAAEPGAADPGAALPPAAATGFRRALAELLEHDAQAHRRVVEELAFLSNVLLAGDTSIERAWQPVEAAERVLELCDEGLRALARREASGPAATREVLAQWGAVGCFRLAWASRAGSA